MLINIHCAKCIGIDAVPVTVEIDIATGIGIHLVGLADSRREGKSAAYHYIPAVHGIQDTGQEDRDKSGPGGHA